MHVFYPNIDRRRIPVLAGVTVAGALVAGLYGAIHDQVTYSLGPEYFTKLKFYQFHGADFGFPPRVFVSEIGFLASWWVGLIAGWLVARMVVEAGSSAELIRRAATAFGIIFVAAGVTAAGAGIFARCRQSHVEDPLWREVAQQLHVTDPGAFFTVAFIHEGSYLGGAVGTLVALVYLWRMRGASGNTRAQ